MNQKTAKKARRMYRSNIEKAALSDYGKITMKNMKLIARQRDITFLIAIGLLILLIITNFDKIISFLKHIY